MCILNVFVLMMLCVTGYYILQPQESNTGMKNHALALWICWEEDVVEETPERDCVLRHITPVQGQLQNGMQVSAPTGPKTYGPVTVLGPSSDDLNILEVEFDNGEVEKLPLAKLGIPVAFVKAQDSTAFKRKRCYIMDTAPGFNGGPKSNYALFFNEESRVALGLTELMAQVCELRVKCIH